MTREEILSEMMGVQPGADLDEYIAIALRAIEDSRRDEREACAKIAKDAADALENYYAGEGEWPATLDDLELQHDPWRVCLALYDAIRARAAGDHPCDCHLHERQVCDLCQGVNALEGKS